MVQSNPSSAMQKTYDNCYLICSTAVYFEGQNNKVEALRSWRNALEQIYHHKAFYMPTNYHPKSETEKALHVSLRKLELQCKERVDTLEGLKEGRSDVVSAAKNATGQSPDIHGVEIAEDRSNAINSSDTADLGSWPGNSKTQRANQAIPSQPALPRRPAPAQRSSSYPTQEQSQSTPRVSQTIGLVNYSSSPSSLRECEPKAPSPERKLLRTLRTNSKERNSPKLASPRLHPPAATKAATQAWDYLRTPVFGKKHKVDTEDTASAPRGLSSHHSLGVLGSRPDSHPNTASFNAHAASIAAQITLAGEGSSPRNSEESKINLHRQLPTAASASPPLPQKRVEHGGRVTVPMSLTSSTDSSPRREIVNATTRIKKASISSHQRGNSTSTVKYDPNTRSLITEKLSLYTTPTPPAPIRDHRGNPKSGLLSVPSEGGVNFSREPSWLAVGASQQRQHESEQAIGANRSKYLSPDRSDALAGEISALDTRIEIERAVTSLPHGTDPDIARQILGEIVIHGDEVHWEDIAGLDVAKAALKETVVYPFLRPDLFMGLREPAQGMLLFGPPGTGKTMLARAVATESKSTFFAISASSLTSKYLGESEKLVRTLFSLARILAPSIIFVDEIDSLLSSRAGPHEHEATRRIKTEFLIQWSCLAKAAAGRDRHGDGQGVGDPSRVLVLAATNLPWVIDEAARRRFVRRQYIPLPEASVRKLQLEHLLSHQTHNISSDNLDTLVELTESFSGSDITALAKDAAMGPLRTLGDRLLHTSKEEIRPIEMSDFIASLGTIRPSVGKDGLKKFDDWAKEFGERGG